MSGVKETKEVLVAVLKVAPVLVKQFKDGVQVQDVAELYAKFMADAELKAAVMAAYDNYKMVGDEVKDLETAEIIELIMAALPEIQKLLQEMKK
jgi:hypothetical protein